MIDTRLAMLSDIILKALSVIILSSLLLNRAITFIVSGSSA